LTERFYEVECTHISDDVDTQAKYIGQRSGLYTLLQVRMHATFIHDQNDTKIIFKIDYD